MGRPPKLTLHQRREAIARRNAGEALTDIARYLRRVAHDDRPADRRAVDLIVLILARVALQAAIRSEDDLFALLKDTTTPPAFPPPVELALA
jgi:hypothetical protein